MKLTKVISALGAGVALVASTLANAAGLMTPANSNLPELTLQEHHVAVTIDDGYATTEIEQTFFNPNSAELEAIYSFPVPESAAVGEFTYWIDGQPVVGEVVEKTRARKIYQAEKAAGHNTALVEKNAFKTFDINVYPVSPNAAVKVRLVYIQPAQVDTGVGRYVYPLEDGGVDEQAQSFWQRNESVTEAFSFTMTFRSSYPIAALRLPKHPNATINQLSENEWRASLSNHKNSEAANPAASVMELNQDIVAYWRHQTGLPGSVDLITHKPTANEPGTFMLTLTPGDDLGAVSDGKEWVFVLDISGSMQGKYATLVEGVRQGLGKLRQQDRFKVVLFNEHAVALTQGFVAVTQENTESTLQRLETYPIGGSTNLYAGLQQGLANIDADRPAGIILVTDGVANVGNTEKKSFLELLAKNDVRLFTFIMGNSANRPLLKEMTEVSNGFALSVSNSDDIVGHIALATQKLTHQAFRDVQLCIEGGRVRNVTPEHIGSLYRGEQLTVFGHYWQAGPATLTLTAKVGSEEKIYRTEVIFPEQNQRNPEIERLWAFATIEHLQAQMDYFGADDDQQQAITDIAVEYGLVTDYTSMIVVQEQVFQAQNINRNNQQRVAQEQQARANRAQQPVQDNRIDKQQPMFQSPRPSLGGGGGSGALGPVFLMALMLLLLRTRRGS
ncbi:VIT and vWA domain-containing protein [Halioxenophilus aromaticivorans]|uniref:VWA domain-containing protein n=1 Tax=Halioxenophilus aromaticivorans TaxID=1306992 RepID=A0AAV3U5D5_9ALTE